MTRKLLRSKGSRWCEIEVTLENGRLSICGSEGRIITNAAAKREARQHWESFFEECPEELGQMAIKYGKRTAKSAAAFVLASDGELHGLDVHKRNGRVYVTESCGQIVDSLRKWFPEAEPYLKWHLNDMHSECEHQEARGETWATHPSAICPDCGYKLGSAWLKRQLPIEVVKWVESL